MKMFDEIIGWYGAVAVLLAYSLANFGVIGVHSLLYQLLNITGGCGIGYLSFKKRAYQPFVLNIVWTLIAVVSIVKIF